MEIFLIAVSLALDAMAVSISTGITLPGFSWRQGMKLALWFGGFQFFMPLLGWFLGSRVAWYMEAFGPWVAFALLGVIGGRMFWQGLSGTEEEGLGDLSPRRLCILAVATSVDAWAVGVSMAFWQVNILSAAGVIGLVAFLLSLLGGFVGKKLGTLFHHWAQVIGGLILVGMGIKTLLEHLG